MNALLAQFKKGQKNAIAVQAEARQEREERLAKAEQTGGLPAGGAGRRRRAAAAAARLPARWLYSPYLTLPPPAAAKAKAKPRARKTASAASGDASASVASGGLAAAAADWKQRSRSGQQAVPLGVKLKAVVDFLRTCSEPQRAASIIAATGL